MHRRIRYFQVTQYIMQFTLVSIEVFILFSKASTPQSMLIASPLEQASEPFLIPPFYGPKRVTSVFDHEYPTYNCYPNTERECGFEVPDGYVAPTHVLHYDGNRYTNDNDPRSYYNGHNGIDYGAMFYDLVRAAGNGRVIYAGWQDPQDHGTGYGLFVRIRHYSDNNYRTIYSHLSVVSVDTNIAINDALESSGRVIGISGNTGYSDGAHLHFELEPPDGMYAVNPYGWNGEVGGDPWENWFYNEDHHGYTSHDLWAHYPCISNTAFTPYPYTSGNAIPLPDDPDPGAEGVVLVDESSSNFTEEPLGCWTQASSGYSDTLRYTSTFTTTEAEDYASCVGTWTLPHLTGRVGEFNVYVYIPSEHASADGAIYEIRHQGEEHQAIVAQAEFLQGGNH